MADGPRLTTLVVEQIEEVMDLHDGQDDDGIVSLEEHRALQGRLEQLHIVAMDVDEGLGLAVTLLRRGPESVSFKRRMVERGIRLMKGGRDRQTAA